MHIPKIGRPWFRGIDDIKERVGGNRWGQIGKTEKYGIALGRLTWNDGAPNMHVWHFCSRFPIQRWFNDLCVEFDFYFLQISEFFVIYRFNFSYQLCSLYHAVEIQWISTWAYYTMRSSASKSAISNNVPNKPIIHNFPTRITRRY